MIDLNFDVAGEPQAPGIVILHGLFGMGRNWAAIGKDLAGEHRVLMVDLRNHGQSPWTEDMDYVLMAADVANLIESEFPGQPVSVIGHSMGGKTAMVLAMTRPDLLSRLAVVDIAPVPYDHDFDAHLSAMQELDVARLSRRTEAEKVFSDAIGDAGIAQFLSRNLAPAENGIGFQWRINVDAIAANMDDILDFPVYEADDAFEGPALFIAGGESDYIQSFHAPEIERLFPNAETEIIDGAGHWVHAEKPSEVTAAIRQFLNT